MTQRTPLKRLAREIQQQRGVPYMVARREAMQILAERAEDERMEGERDVRDSTST